MKPSVFITRQIPESALLPLAASATLEVWPRETPPPAEVLFEKARQVAGMLTLLTDPLKAEFFAQAGEQLKVVSQMAVGVDNIDLTAATQKGIPVGFTPGVLTEATADLTWALLMAAARRVVEADKEVRRGIWRPWGPSVLLGMEVSGATLGIIGFGRIGQAVARRANGFGMRVLCYDPRPDQEAITSLGVTQVPLEQILSDSDFITLHTYLTPETYHLISTGQFKQMKPTAILVNTSRGGVVDPKALYQALKTGQITAAGLDVYEPEPVPDGDPLLELDNVVITPHIASAGVQTRQKMAQIAVDNLLCGLQGKKLPFCANPQVYS